MNADWQRAKREVPPMQELIYRPRFGGIPRRSARSGSS